MKKYKYHCILSNVPKGELLEVAFVGSKVDMYREWEVYCTMSEQQFGEWKNNPDGYYFQKLLGKT